MFGSGVPSNLKGLESLSNSMRACNPNDAVLNALRQRVTELTLADSIHEEDRPFFVVDLGVVYQRYQQWRRTLPGVTPHYAVKCNSDPMMLGLLAILGAGFDCASASEMQSILDLGIEPGRVIYAHPCKTASGLEMANTACIKRMTFDSIDELEKLSRATGQPDLLLRIWTENDGVETHLSRKFGARLDEVQGLLRRAQDLKLNTIGIAFHVGTRASDPAVFVKALRDSRVAFHMAAQIGTHLSVLDLGGGFASHTFEESGKVIRDTIAEQEFPKDVEIIAEPGRFFAEEAFTLACRVLGKRCLSAGSGSRRSSMLYLSDGVYGNFANVVWESQQLCPGLLNVPKFGDVGNVKMVTKGGNCVPDTYTYMLWGPTCDGNDCIMKQWDSEHHIQTGDWLYFPDMGAYSSSCKTGFNGFGDMQQPVYLSRNQLVSNSDRI
jgi:ornithine decarboxylase